MESVAIGHKQEFIAGIKGVAPILLGVAPFGMIYGVLALGAGLPAGAAQAMSSVVFAGSAQFMAVQLVGTGTPAIIIVITAFIINLRHALYSASVAPKIKRLSPLWKALLAYLLTDEAYAVAITRYNQEQTDDPHGHWYFLGAGLGLWAAWQASTAVGVFLGAQVPESWSLDFTLALTFFAVVVPSLKDRASLAAAAAAGVTAVVANGLPYKLGLMAAALVGILVGMWGASRWNSG
jgi:4-azaleucine resistance transporter AzlC